MVSARVVCAIRCHAADWLIMRNLAYKMRQHWRIPGTSAGDLDGCDFQRMFADTVVDLAPNMSFGAAMLAHIPRALALNFDPCAAH